MNPLVIAFAVVGGVWGVVADRIATRWPEHDEPELPGGRATGLADGRQRRRSGRSPWARCRPASTARRSSPCSAPGSWSSTLLLATDLDQRLLPSVITLPLIAAALVVRGLGGRPARPRRVRARRRHRDRDRRSRWGCTSSRSRSGSTRSARATSSSSSASACSRGWSARSRASSWVRSSAGVVIAVLLVTRRVTRKTYIPYGPFLIIGAFWGVLVRFG